MSGASTGRKNIVAIYAADGFEQDRIEKILRHAFTFKTASDLEVPDHIFEDLENAADTERKSISGKRDIRRAESGEDLFEYWGRFTSFKIDRIEKNTWEYRCGHHVANATCYLIVLLR